MNGTVTLTFPQSCELKFAAASERSAIYQAGVPHNLHTFLVRLIAILRKTAAERIDVGGTAT